MKFELSGSNVFRIILLIHVGLAIFDLKFLILPWVFIGFNLWTLATKPLGGQWVPAQMDKVRQMLEMAEIRKGETLYDLGSGDGRIIIEATKIYKAKSVGVEIDPIRVIISRLKIMSNNLNKHAKVKHANIFSTSLRDADIVTMYLLPKTVNKLKSKFKKELRAGSRVVSLQFPIKRWKPMKFDKNSKIFVYKI